jgi:ubiquitin-conjugating enzyme E2 S
VDTPFEGGVFKLRLKLGAEFPAAPPKAHFVTKIFHPNVHALSGEICVNTLKRDWHEGFGVAHILLTVKSLLMLPNAESALNEEAGRLLLDAYDDYCARARLWTAIHAQRKEDASKVKENEKQKGKERERDKDKEKEESASDEGDEGQALGELNANAVRAALLSACLHACLADCCASSSRAAP